MPERSAYESLPSTSLDAQPGTCTRCGHVAGAQAEECPRCGGALASPVPAAPPAAREASSYVEQTLSCTPAELEAIARREAVDGWQLMDTTVDEAQPDRVLANFRRPVSTQEATRPERKPAASAPDPAEDSAQPDARTARKQKRADDRARRRQARPSKARPAGQTKPAAPASKTAPASASGQSTGEYRHEIYLAVMAISVAMAVSWISWPGIFLIWAAPGAAKRIARLSNAQLAVLGALAAGLVSGMNEVGFFVALWALPGVVESIIGDGS